MPKINTEKTLFESSHLRSYRSLVVFGCTVAALLLVYLSRYDWHGKRGLETIFDEIRDKVNPIAHSHGLMARNVTIVELSWPLGLQETLGELESAATRDQQLQSARAGPAAEPAADHAHCLRQQLLRHESVRDWTGRVPAQ